MLQSPARATHTRPNRRLYLSSGWPLAVSSPPQSPHYNYIRVVFLMEHDYCQSISVPLSLSLFGNWRKRGEGSREREQWHLMTIDGRAGVVDGALIVTLLLLRITFAPSPGDS